MNKNKVFIIDRLRRKAYSGQKIVTLLCKLIEIKISKTIIPTQ